VIQEVGYLETSALQTGKPQNSIALFMPKAITKLPCLKPPRLKRVEDP
jgi:hypothetical protein